MKIIDSFEHNISDTHRFLKKNEVPTEVAEEGDGSIYIRYTNHKECAITKVWEENGATKIRWAFGDWNNRASLEYKNIPSEAATV